MGKANWTLCLTLGGTVAFLPDAETALDAMAAHDGEDDDPARWRRRLRRALVTQHGEVVPRNASAALLLTACLRRELVGGGWLQ